MSALVMTVAKLFRRTCARARVLEGVRKCAAARFLCTFLNEDFLVMLTLTQITLLCEISPRGAKNENLAQQQNMSKTCLAIKETLLSLAFWAHRQNCSHSTFCCKTKEESWLLWMLRSSTPT